MKSHRCDEVLLHDPAIQQLHGVLTREHGSLLHNQTGRHRRTGGRLGSGLGGDVDPGAVYNVAANQCYYTISLDNVHFHLTIIPEGNYRRINDLIAAMHSTMPKDIFNEPCIKFTAKGVHTKMTFTELLDTVLSIRFSESLAEILGADADVACDRNHARTSRRFFLVNGDINSVYIYCDILEHVTVEDTKTPLLRIVDKDRKKRGNVHQTFNTILYVPLQKKTLTRWR